MESLPVVEGEEEGGGGGKVTVLGKGLGGKKKRAVWIEYEDGKQLLSLTPMWWVVRVSVQT
jgi:hypothetical protein